MDFCASSPLSAYQPTSTDDRIHHSSVIIRSARTNDVKGISEAIVRSFHDSQGLWWWIYPLLKLGVCEDLRMRLRSPGLHYRCLVASKPVVTPDGEIEEIVGTVEIALGTWKIGKSSCPYISNLAVSHAYRRQGIATKLLHQCEQIALEWGCEMTSLHVLDNNHAARQLYMTSGYQLHRLEFSSLGWLFKHPKRLFLYKNIFCEKG